MATATPGGSLCCRDGVGVFVGRARFGAGEGVEEELEVLELEGEGGRLRERVWWLRRIAAKSRLALEIKDLSAPRKSPIRGLPSSAGAEVFVDVGREGRGVVVVAGATRGGRIPVGCGAACCAAILCDRDT